MRHTKLIWFALGVGVAALIFLTARWYLQSPRIEHHSTAYLVLEEPPANMPEGRPENEEARNLAMIANQTGDLMRECGAKKFETTGVYEGHAATAELPLAPENSTALACIVRESTNRGIRLKIEMRMDRNA